MDDSSQTELITLRQQVQAQAATLAECARNLEALVDENVAPKEENRTLKSLVHLSMPTTTELPRTLTAAYLRQMGACEDQVRQFELLFPRGARPTRRMIKRAQDAELNVGWFIRNVLPRAALEQYQAAQRAAREQYQAAKRPAWEQYQAAQRPAWEQYQAAQRAALEQYQAAQRAALEQYQAAKRPAWEQYQAAQRAAWEQYQAATRAAQIEVILRTWPAH